MSELWERSSVICFRGEADMRLNYKLRQLNLTSEDRDLLVQISQELRLKPTDLCRALLHSVLMEMKAEGTGNYRLALIKKGKRGKGKWKI